MKTRASERVSGEWVGGWVCACVCTCACVCVCARARVCARVWNVYVYVRGTEGRGEGGG